MGFFRDISWVEVNVVATQKSVSKPSSFYRRKIHVSQLFSAICSRSNLNEQIVQLLLSASSSAFQGLPPRHPQNASVAQQDPPQRQYRTPTNAPLSEGPKPGSFKLRPLGPVSRIHGTFWVWTGQELTPDPPGPSPNR